MPAAAAPCRYPTAWQSGEEVERCGAIPATHVFIVGHVRLWELCARHATLIRLSPPGIRGTLRRMGRALDCGRAAD
jgi:hypothetical protein